MGRTLTEITPDTAEWIGRQHMFFVATAPLSNEGFINCSPKGLDTFRILGPREAIYLDLTGSGVETIAHLRENGRIVLMFCAFEGAPKILRLHGRGTVHAAGTQRYENWKSLFPEIPGSRAIIHVEVTRVADSCGFGVPHYEYKGDRQSLIDLAVKKGPAAILAYQAEKNAQSLNGLPGLPTAV
jgi:hypothetical protein